MLNDKTKFNSAEVEQHLAAFGRATQSAPPEFRDGEIAAGLILETESGNIYHLVLMPGELINVTWDQAKAIFAATGGDLPDTCEMTLLESNLSGEFDHEEQYWSNEVARFNGDTIDTVMYHSFGPLGCFEFTNKDDTMSARGVRRVPVAFVPERNTAAGPDLSDLPEMQRMREALLKPVQPATARDLVDTLARLNAIIDADDNTGLVATVCQCAVNTINGLMLIVDPEKLTGHPVETNTSTAAILQQPRDNMRVDPALLQPKVSIQEVAELLAQLDEICDKDAEDDLTALRRLALHVIGGLLAHAGAEVLA